MKKKLIFVIFLCIYTYFPVLAMELRHTIGGEFSFYGATSFNGDPYSLPSGLGIFYTINKFDKPSFVFGANLLWYGFVPSRFFYSGSIMLVPSVSSGYNFVFDLSNKSGFSLLPYISYGQYIRSIETDESTSWFSRPVITGGVDIILNTEIRTASAFGFFVSALMDNIPVIMPGFRVKTGYSWEADR